MSYYDEEFYNELNEFDQQIDEFRDSLLKSIKSEFIAEMDRLKAENAELLVIKKDFAQIQNNYKNKHRQLEIDRQDIELKVKKERLNQLMADFQTTLYTARSNHVKPPKCDKCDEKRKIAYTTPLGKIAHEDCECSTGKNVYYPQEFECVEFFIERDGNGIRGIYKKHDYGDDGYKESGISSDDIYKTGTDYEKLNYYRTMFRAQEECQKYCDWLNARVTNG